MIRSRKKRNSLFLIVGVILVIALFWLIYGKDMLVRSYSQSMQNSLQATADATRENAFVTRSGSMLLLAGKPYRFSGANIYWLGLQEAENGSSYPTHFEVDDVLATASFMGATVVRAHTLGISVGCSLCAESSLDVFSQQAWEAIDYAIQSAHKHHMRLIIPFTDNWRYYHGGKHTFVEWRGLSDEEDFYSNVQVIGDFEHYIGMFLNHVNHYTGLAYKDDPTILAWETGNELSAPVSWVQQISLYIKKIDPRHLVLDGNYEQASEVSNFLPDLAIPTVDMYTGHYYPPTRTSLLKASEQASNAHKVFLVGEYDWNTEAGTSLTDFFSSIEQSNIAGDMYWSLFPHDDQHGFVSHNEHYTLYYPGDTSDMRERIRLIRVHAYAMQKKQPPTNLPPGIPLITTLSGEDLLWRGAYGADSYSIERSTQGVKGPWEVVCNRCVTDFTFSWRDPQVLASPVAYRMRAYSVAGVPGSYSPPFVLLYR